MYHIDMPDYSKGKIYCIRSNQTEGIYIGSTCQTLSSRWAAHRVHYRNYLATGERFISAFDVMQYEDAYIELICDFPCESKQQLILEEGRRIRQTPNAVNRAIAGRTQAEWYQDNRANILLQCKQKYQENKEQRHQKYLQNKEARQYYLDNREAKLRYQQEYAARRKAIIVNE